MTSLRSHDVPELHKGQIRPDSSSSINNMAEHTHVPKRPCWTAVSQTCCADQGQRPRLRAGETGVHLGELGLQVLPGHQVPPPNPVSWAA